MKKIKYQGLALISPSVPSPHSPEADTFEQLAEYLDVVHPGSEGVLVINVYSPLLSISTVQKRGHYSSLMTNICKYFK